jgi:hypothetical protein
MSFSALGADELAHVLAFASARDVEALTVAARVVAREVLPENPAVWRGLFLRQWEALNFPLPGVRDGSAALVLDPRVGLLFDRCGTQRRPSSGAIADEGWGHVEQQDDRKPQVPGLGARRRACAVLR